MTTPPYKESRIGNRRRRRGKPAATLLVVDPDTEMRSAVSAVLARAGYEVTAVGTADAGLREALSGRYRLVILDLLLPDGDGKTVLSRLLAARPHQFVVVLTRVSDAATKASCLEIGARDYLTKPFAPRELLARVHLRLNVIIPPAADGDGPHADGFSRHAWEPRDEARGRAPADGADLRLDVGHLTADIGHGPVRLTRTEFCVLKLLADHAGRPIPCKRLLAEVWGYHSGARSNVVGVCMRRLRTKLGTRMIETVRGEGYMLVGAAMSPRRPDHGPDALAR